MKLYSAESMRLLDQETIASGISGRRLMGRACRALAEELLFFAEGHPRAAVVLCGPGNNGGDGYGLAWQLHQQGWSVEVWSVIAEDRVKGDAAFFMEEARSSGVRIRTLLDAEAWREAEIFLPAGAWLVDALLGTGATEAPRGAVALSVEFLQAHRVGHRIWSVDVPSGLNVDTGEAFEVGCCVKADHTLTLGGAKTGFELDGSAIWTGSVSVLELGLDPELLVEKGEGEWQVLSRQQAARWMPPMAEGDHKGSRGHALLIGGSPGMSGAICMTARAALRCGCGLATVLTPHTCAQVVDGAQAELIVIPGKQGKYQSLCYNDIPYHMYSSVCMGPGMRINDDTFEFVNRVLAECRSPLVLDADALNALNGIDQYFCPSLKDKWLTPHPGELGRFLNMRGVEVQRDRCHHLKTVQSNTGAMIVLKGSRSRVAQSLQDQWVNLNGNSGMATGGTGDVLAGILAGLIARGVEKSRALPLAVYVHGRAGDLAAMRKGQSGMIAGDVVEAIPAVLQQLQGR
jgi:NAD(P)H-hydrate epimerase